MFAYSPWLVAIPVGQITVQYELRWFGPLPTAGPARSARTSVASRSTATSTSSIIETFTTPPPQEATRANCQFTRELSLRLILDYNGVQQNSALINLDRQKRIMGDILLTYLLHPGTAFYIGYTDRLENLALFPGQVSPNRFSVKHPGRQFFTKISYQFRF